MHKVDDLSASGPAGGQGSEADAFEGRCTQAACGGLPIMAQSHPTVQRWPP